MNQIFDFFLEAYKNASTSDIILELLAFLFGIASVWFAKKENILVYPTGLVATIITVYLLYNAEYFGDMMMNFYYSVMSIYGWYIWTRKVNNIVTPISKVSLPEKITSSIAAPRMAFAELAPITHLIASSKLDFPQPLGPTIPVKPGFIMKSVGSTNDLKPVNLI